MLNNIDKVRDLLPIDKNDLDNELIQHPVHGMEIYAKVAEEHSKRDAEKDRLKRAYASQYRELKEAGGMTEKQIDSEILIDDEYKRLQRKYQKQCSVCSEWDAAKEAWLSRGFMLKAMVDLNTASYFETPRR